MDFAFFNFSLKTPVTRFWCDMKIKKKKNGVNISEGVTKIYHIITPPLYTPGSHLVALKLANVVPKRSRTQLLAPSRLEARQCSREALSR